MTETTFEQDDARCYLLSRGMPQQGFMFAGGGTGTAGAAAAGYAAGATLGAAIGLAIQQQKDRDTCMMLSGWRKARVQSQ